MTSLSTLARRAAAAALLICAAGGFSMRGATTVAPGHTAGRECSDGLASEAAEVEAAVFISPEMLAVYADASVSGVKTSLHSRLNVESMTVWVREDLNGENLREVTLQRKGAPTFTRDENLIMLTEPYAISAAVESGVYVGVSLKTTGTSKTVCTSTGAAGTPGSAYMRENDGAWADKSDAYAFFIDALVTGENLPVDRVRLAQVDFSPYLILDRGDYSASFMVLNTGVNTVTSLAAELDMEGVCGPERRTFECCIEPQQTATFSIGLETGVTEGEGEHPVSLTVTAVNGVEPPAGAAPRQEGVYIITPYDMRRRVLLEEFTTERCPNCPRVAEYVHSILGEERYNDLVVPMCHHSGYGTDQFTHPSDSEYLWLYDPTFVFAPAVMIDRLPIVESVAPFNPQSEQSLARVIDDAAGRESFVSVSLHAEVKEGAVEVTVRGAKAKDTLCDDARLVCVLTEDDIPGPAQSGYDGPGTYVHQHVCRAVSETWGSPVDFDGNEYEHTFTLETDKVNEIENINVVAYIFNYNSENRRDCEVQNAAMLRYAEMDTAGVIPADGRAETSDEAWYTMQGIRLGGKPTAPGIYIRGTKKVLLPGIRHDDY